MGTVLGTGGGFREGHENSGSYYLSYHVSFVPSVSFRRIDRLAFAFVVDLSLLVVVYIALLLYVFPSTWHGEVEEGKGEAIQLKSPGLSHASG